MNDKKQIRKIIHIDMDAFYASVEQRDNPYLRGKPVIVGGPPDSRGVVSTCSYEARSYGVHSAMSSSQAYRLCKTAIFVQPHFSKYKEVSRQINEIFHVFTDLVEPLSLDEAFLDVTANKKLIKSATIIARHIRHLIYHRTGLTASAGVSYNKFLAKVASDIRKPNGLTVVTPDHAVPFIEKLSIKKFFGIGKVTASRMERLGIYTGADLKKLPLEKMIELFGKNGVFYFNIARGVDDRPVDPVRIRKSYGKEITLKHDISTALQVISVIKNLCVELIPLLDRDKVRGRTVTLKIKYSDFKSVTRSSTSSGYKNFTKALIIKNINGLLKYIEFDKSIRLVGVSISNLEDQTAEYYQPELDFHKDSREF